MQVCGYEINEITAYMYNDTYRIEDSSGEVVATEHNQAEAEAVANWLTGQRQRAYRARRNPKDVVRAAQAIRPDPVRVPDRDRIIRTQLETGQL